MEVVCVLLLWDIPGRQMSNNVYAARLFKFQEIGQYFSYNDLEYRYINVQICSAGKELEAQTSHHCDQCSIPCAGKCDGMWSPEDSGKLLKYTWKNSNDAFSPFKKPVK